MFISERKKNDVFLIDGGITIKILRITEDKVKLGIDVPKNIFITERNVVDNQNGVTTMNEKN